MWSRVPGFRPPHDSAVTRVADVSLVGISSEHIDRHEAQHGEGQLSS